MYEVTHLILKCIIMGGNEITIYNTVILVRSVIQFSRYREGLGIFRFYFVLSFNGTDM